MTAIAPSLPPGLSDVKNIIAIASGKGGVGKSTVTVNLAMALTATGATVGILDADVYGPTIPALLGLKDRRMGPEDRTADQRLQPISGHGIALMSMGFLTGPDTPAIWRGPLASRMIVQFLDSVAWGSLDYLLVDLPPGTGDIQLTLTQSVPLTGAIVVSTPQDIALKVAERGLHMFETVGVPVMGMVENMASYRCHHCGERDDIFPVAGVEAAAAALSLPLLARLPLDRDLARASDAGIPMAVSTPDAPMVSDYAALASTVLKELDRITAESAGDLRPERIEDAGQGHLRIGWSDGHQALYSYRALRGACPCAGCVSEDTGKRLVGPDQVATEITLRDSTAIGRYALRLAWSDGHQTGIYTLSRLYSLCGCSQHGGTAPAALEDAMRNELPML